MKILFCASECTPFAKTGGLADVVGALPKALSKLGEEVKIVMPRYWQIDRDTLEHVPGPLEVDMDPLGTLHAGVFKSRLPNSDVEVYFIDYELFFGRKGLYADDQGFSYPDNDRRFIFLSKAALSLCKKIGFIPDIFHAHDWHTAAIPTLLKFGGDPTFAKSRSVLTIHNLQHQGFFDAKAMEYLGIGWEHFNPYELEAMGGLNLLKGGIAHADMLSTVSPTYAKEIQTPQYGFGLQEHIKAHAHKLVGILNGVDYEEWNPATDPYIAQNYDRDRMEGKAVCKEDLQNHFGLQKREDIPLVGFVGRFAQQKGIELIAQTVEGFLHLPAQFVMLGTGEKWAEGFFSDVSGRYDNFRVYVGFSNELAHKIEAGSDLFLMPSLFEPCGLNQIYSLRYGTLPVVRGVGGLEDTVENFDPKNKTGNGFKFYDATPDALYHTLKWAIETWLHDKEAIERMQNYAMCQRFDWEHSALHYQELYQKAICK